MFKRNSGSNVSNLRQVRKPSKSSSAGWSRSRIEYMVCKIADQRTKSSTGRLKISITLPKIRQRVWTSVRLTTSPVSIFLRLRLKLLRIAWDQSRNFLNQMSLIIKIWAQWFTYRALDRASPLVSFATSMTVKGTFTVIYLWVIELSESPKRPISSRYCLSLPREIMRLLRAISL